MPNVSRVSGSVAGSVVLGALGREDADRSPTDRERERKRSPTDRDQFPSLDGSAMFP